MVAEQPKLKAQLLYSTLLSLKLIQTSQLFGLFGMSGLFPVDVIFHYVTLALNAGGHELLSIDWGGGGEKDEKKGKKEEKAEEDEEAEAEKEEDVLDVIDDIIVSLTKQRTREGHVGAHLHHFAPSSFKRLLEDYGAMFGGIEVFDRMLLLPFLFCSSAGCDYLPHLFHCLWVEKEDILRFVCIPLEKVKFFRF